MRRVWVQMVTMASRILVYWIQDAICPHSFVLLFSPLVLPSSPEKQNHISESDYEKTVCLVFYNTKIICLVCDHNLSYAKFVNLIIVRTVQDCQSQDCQYYREDLNL